MKQFIYLLLVLLLVQGWLPPAHAEDDDPCGIHWQSIDDLEREKPKLREILEFARKYKPIAKKTHEELGEYGAKMRRTLNENITKTLMKGWIDVFNEIGGMISGTKIADDILSWIGQKAISIEISDSNSKIGRFFVGDAYYKKKYDMISTKVHNLTPELQKLVQLSGSSQEAMLAWLNKYNDNTDWLTPGDTALFTNRMRLLVIQTEAAKRSLYALYMELDATEKDAAQMLAEAQQEIDKQKVLWNQCLDRKNNPQKPLPPVDPVETETVKLETSTVGDGYQQGIKSARDKEAEERIHTLMKQAAQKAREVAEYFENVRQALDADVQRRSDEITNILEQAANKREKERKALFESVRHPNFYGYDESVYTNSESMANCPTLHVPYSQAISETKRLQEEWEQIEQEWLDTFLAAAALAEENAVELPQLEMAGSLASLLADSISYDKALAAGYEQLRLLRAKMILAEELGYPYGLSDTISRRIKAVNDGAHSFAVRGAELRNRFAIEEQQLQNQKAMHAQEQALLPQSAASCIKRVTAGLEAQIELIDRALSAAAAREQAAKPYLAFFDSLASRGVVEINQRNGQNSYEVSNQWLESVTESAEGSCEALDTIQSALEKHANTLFSLRMELDAANFQFSRTGFPTIQRNLVAELNVPGLESTLQGTKPLLEKALARHQESSQALSRLTSNLGEISAMVTEKKLHMTSLPVLKKIDAKQRDFYKGTGNLIVQLNSRMNSLLSLERIHAQEKKELPKALERYRKEYAKEVGCLGDDHPYTKNIYPLFGEIKQRIAKLQGRPTYADAGSLLTALQQIKEAVFTTPLDDDDAYRTTILTLREQFAASKARFSANKGSFATSDQTAAGQLIYDIERQFPVHLEHLTRQNELANDKEIAAFYDAFKQAYEGKNESLVMSLIHDDWSAAGGVTLFDLEDNLRNMYNVFDDIQYDLSGLRFSKAGDNLYNVSYSVTIRGMIYDNDLQHEEVSAVTEQVILEEGKVKIFKTLNGNYWSIR